MYKNYFIAFFNIVNPSYDISDSRQDGAVYEGEQVLLSPQLLVPSGVHVRLRRLLYRGHAAHEGAASGHDRRVERWGMIIDDF